MRLMALPELKPNMVLGRSIYSSEGKLLLGAGVQLQPRLIERLRELGIYSVYIADEGMGEIVIQDIINERTRLEARQVVRDSLSKVDVTKDIDVRKVKGIVNNIMDELLTNKDLLVQLADIRSISEYEYTFNHCVNVAVLSILTGIARGYNQIQLQELGTGALLHDIGKCSVNVRIFEKKEHLTPDEYSQIHKHVVLGFEILRRQENVSLLSAHVALQHHERYNGSGYPRNLKGAEIHEYARIVTIADVYDALTSDRPYRKRYLPHEAAEFILSLGGHYFDPQLVTLFLHNIAIYPAGTPVTLSTGQRAVVIGCHKSFPTRPLVRIINPGSAEHFSELNLLDHPSIFIREVENCSSFEQRPLIITG